jgi:hypothetical protein
MLAATCCRFWLAPVADSILLGHPAAGHAVPPAKSCLCGGRQRGCPNPALRGLAAGGEAGVCVRRAGPESAGGGTQPGRHHRGGGPTLHLRLRLMIGSKLG